MSWKRKALLGRFKSGHLHCCTPLVTFVRQCDNSTLQSGRGPCGRTAAHRPTYFCKNAAPAILPEANLVLPLTKGVASCPDQNSVVCVRNDARKKNSSTPASSPKSSCDLSSLPAGATAHCAIPRRASTTTPTTRPRRGSGIPSARRDD